MLSSAALLALSEQDFNSIAVWIIGGIAGLVYVVNAGTEIIERYRANPPATELFAKKSEIDELRGTVAGIIADKVTRSELRDAHGRIDGCTTMVNAAVADLKKTVTNEIQEHRKEIAEVTKALTSIHRALGRLEGQHEADQ